MRIKSLEDLKKIKKDSEEKIKLRDRPLDEKTDKDRGRNRS